MKKTTAIFLASLLFGGIGTVLFFSILDPVDLRFVGPLELGRKLGYGIGFVFFWAIAAGSSSLTSILERWHVRR